MVNSGLLISSFYITRKYSRNQKQLYLNKYYAEGKNNDLNAIDYLLEFMYENISIIDDDKMMKLFSIDEKSIIKKETENYCFVTCIVKSGSYGIESEITDRLTEQVVYKRTNNDADIKNFRCLFYVLKNINNYVVKKGIAVFQTIGNYGIKTITLKYLKKFFSEKNLIFEVKCISVYSFLKDKLENNKIKRISFIKNIMNSDDSENIFVNKGREELSYFEPHLKFTLVDKIKKLLANIEKKENYVIEIDDIEYEDIKFTFIIGKSQKTVSIQHIDKFSIVEDIPNEIYVESRYNSAILIDHMLSSIFDYIDYIDMYDEIVV